MQNLLYILFYRSVTEVARQLDDERSQAQVVCDLFLPTLVTKQCKLKDYCERLIFAQPLLYGRRVEELLWRKAFYDVVNAAKKIAIKVCFITTLPASKYRE